MDPGGEKVFIMDEILNYVATMLQPKDLSQTSAYCGSLKMLRALVAGLSLLPENLQKWMSSFWGLTLITPQLLDVGYPG
jgi:hypothetical protein